LSEHLPDGAAGQVRSVAKRFAVIGAAGELASCYGITGWPEGEAVLAADICFKGWLSARNTTGKHGGARFEQEKQPEGFATMNRAGWRWHDSRHGELYGFTPESWKGEALSGLDARGAAKELLARGWLVADTSGRPDMTKRIGGVRRRLYAVSADIMSGAATRVDAKREAASDQNQDELL
jgi:putative DNA primase/helicase